MVALAALIVAAVLLLSQQTPLQGRNIDSIFEDESLLVDEPLTEAGGATVVSTLATLKQLGVDRVRVIVDWDQVAPDASSSTPPAGFDAADPADYPEDASSGVGWTRYDRIDAAAANEGIKVYFDLAGPAPAWAAASQPAGTPASARRYADPTDDTYSPSAAAFAEFVEAAGRRYSGTYHPSDYPGHALARISFWSVWNEPNQPGWLAPQFDPSSGRALAPALYRALAGAFWTGMERSGHTPSSDTLLVGELAPSGCVSGVPCHYPGGQAYAPMPPLSFLEDLYCVGPAGREATTTSVGTAHLEVLRGAAATGIGCPASGDAARFRADNPALFQASGLAEHPYSFLLAPNISDTLASDAAFAPLADLGRLEATIDASVRADGSSVVLPLYLTEYGYVTNPPNPKYTVTPAQQAVYLDEAEYMAVQNPRVRALAQFELQDSNPALECRCVKGSPGYWDNFEEGLEYLGGAHKPAFAAYRLPIWLPGLESGDHTVPAGAGSPVQVWGMLRPAANDSTQTAQVQFADARGGGWQTLATTTTRDPSGILSVDVVLPASGAVRLAWSPPRGPAIYSRSVAVSVR